MDRLALKEKAQQLLGKYRYVILVLLVGVVLMLLPSRQEKTNQTYAAAEHTEQKQDIQKELTQILSQIDGVGAVQVMLTIASGEETVYQTDTENTDDTCRIDTVIVTDGNRTQQGLVQMKNPPKYLGAIVVCKGGGNAAVRLAVVEAVSRVTGLGAGQISVLKMK
jgi:stage III sporulation protein AG